MTALGISTTVFDANKDGHEDKDILEAIIIANRGEEIPEDLKIRIQRKQEKEGKREGFIEFLDCKILE